MSTTVIVQARMGSSRLPGKVMRDVVGRPMIELLLERVKVAQCVDQIVVATSDQPVDDKLCAFVESLGYQIFRGSEADVLDRYYRAATQFEASSIVRLTGDCPLMDPAVVDQVINLFKASGADYASNCLPPSFPDGLDVEVFSYSILERAQAEAKAPHDREHVTPFFRRGDFRTANLQSSKDVSQLRWSVDEVADLHFARAVFGYFAPAIDFEWAQVIQLMKKNPEIAAKNQAIPRNEGITMTKGQKLWCRAKQIIPGGNMLLSKRAEMHLPEKWPSYFSKSKGCKVWDLDGREYFDTYLMGVGTNILGYANEEIDAAVMGAVKCGNLSTFNAPEEVWLAEKLIELDPWSGMVRFARSGGEANAIATRIGRASSGKDGVAVCGYHGWHDWYLSANLGENDSLAGHLLPGLNPTGVPKALRGTVHTFNYNDFEALEKIVASYEIGVIKMEVFRNMPPQNNFLTRIRELASRKGIVLIFDECTSGFRETFGGLHKKYGVEPDIAVYGKTLGNGYAITAVVGREEVMQSAQNTFISSTFWTERIGPTAALKTLEVMERETPWEHATDLGLYLRDLWQQLAHRHGLQIDISGLPSLSGFTFQSPRHLAYKTLITQEMLKKGYLAGTACYVSLAHTRAVFDSYAQALDPIFGLIKQCEDGRDIDLLLEGPVCHAGFQRVN